MLWIQKQSEHIRKKLQANNITGRMSLQKYVLWTGLKNEGKLDSKEFWNMAHGVKAYIRGPMDWAKAI
jgi:hypothetical protein